MTTAVVSPPNCRLSPEPRSLRSVFAVIGSVVMLSVAVPPRREPRVSAWAPVAVLVPTRVTESAVASLVASRTAPLMVVTLRLKAASTPERSWVLYVEALMVEPVFRFTLEAVVTTAAITSSAVPLTVWALVTVTMPVEALPTALRSAA